MIRPVVSPGLGLVLVHNEARRPLIAPDVPAFHVDEVQLLSRTKAPLSVWKDIAFVRRVFPEAYLVEWIDYVRLRKQWERRMKRTRLWSSGRPEPAAEQDE